MRRTAKQPVPSLSLFPVNSHPEPYKKAVPILHSKPRQSFSLLQRKAANSLLKNALETEPNDDGFFTMSTIRLRDDIEMNSNNFDALRTACTEMMHILFEWDILATKDKRIKWKQSALFPEMELTRSEIRYQISSQLLPQLKRPEVYAMIDMAVVRRFKKPAALAIWEYGVRFEQIGHTTPMPWEDFRNMVLSDEVASQRTYAEYKHFKDKQLKPAIAEINFVSDHAFELLEIKNGRKVESLQFNVTRKKQPANGLDPDDLPTLRELRDLGLKQDEATLCIKQYGRDRVAASLMATRKRISDKKLGTLQSPKAWFRWRLRTNSDSHEPSASPTKPVRAKIDLKQQFLVHRRGESESYFKELSPEMQTEHIDEYNAWQTTPLLKLTPKKRTAVAADSFFHWLATKTWGEPTAEQILDFAQDSLANAT